MGLSGRKPASRASLAGGFVVLTLQTAPPAGGWLCPAGIGLHPAYQIASTICGWAAAATGNDPQHLRAEYRLDGTPIGQNLTAGPGIVGMLSTGCMVEPTHQPMLDATYDWMNSQLASYDIVYYQSSLQVLAALLLTGNMPYLFPY